MFGTILVLDIGELLASEARPMSLIVVVDVLLYIDEVSEGVKNGGIA